MLENYLSHANSGGYQRPIGVCHMAATQTSPMKLAKLTNAKILPVFIHRVEERIQVEIYAALDNFPSTDMEQDALRLNKLLESFILVSPAQYLWTHRKFKTRPDHEAKLYPQKPRRLKKKSRTYD